MRKEKVHPGVTKGDCELENVWRHTDSFCKTKSGSCETSAVTEVTKQPGWGKLRGALTAPCWIPLPSSGLQTFVMGRTQQQMCVSGTARKLQFLSNGGKCAAVKACKWTLESVHPTLCAFSLCKIKVNRFFFFVFFFLFLFNEYSNA